MTISPYVLGVLMKGEVVSKEDGHLFTTKHWLCALD